ncbi:MAG: ribonuclease III domain-containing protein [Clostridia bacterium]|nr:ribonuclease III domain-containing protein [Clostridia bacterium]
MPVTDLMSERPELLPSLTLAYIGDVVYELAVRQHLLEKGIYKVNDMHKAAVGLVCAKTQAVLVHLLEDEFTETENAVMHRGRNAKGQHNPKSVPVTTYRQATGLEALIGYWYLTKDELRLGWFFERLWQFAEAEKTE